MCFLLLINKISFYVVHVFTKYFRSVAACGSYEEGEDVTTEDPSVHEMSKKLYRYSIMVFTHLINSSFFVSLHTFTLMIFYSIQKSLKAMESRHSVRQRWKPGDREFDAAALQINNQRREDTINALHVLSIERHFLLTLKKKYAGNFVFFILISFQEITVHPINHPSASYLVVLFYVFQMGSK